MTAVENAEKWYLHFMDMLNHDTRPWDRENYAKQIKKIYEMAVWVDANLKGQCVIDPFFNFHFYEEEDAVAFKLKWEE